MYSSSWVGRNTHASWKNGLRDVFVVERSRECVGLRPTRSANDICGIEEGLRLLLG